MKLRKVIHPYLQAGTVFASFMGLTLVFETAAGVVRDKHLLCSDASPFGRNLDVMSSFLIKAERTSAAVLHTRGD